MSTPDQLSSAERVDAEPALTAGPSPVGLAARFERQYGLLSDAPCNSGSTVGGDAVIWECYYGLFVGETILKLRGEDASWRQTVMGILYDHQYFLDTQQLPCEEYDSEFLLLAKDVAKVTCC